MELIQLTAVSIALLTQSSLLLLCIVYLVLQKDLRTTGWIMIGLCFSALLFCVTLFSVESLRNYNPIRAFLLPLQYIPISLTITAVIQLVYRFPIDSTERRFERNIVLGISLSLAICISILTLTNPLEIVLLELWIMNIICLLGYAWALFVTVRNAITYLQQTDQTFPQFILQPLSQSTLAFNYWLIIMLTPLPILGIVALSYFGFIRPSISNFTASTGGLLFIYFFVTIYLNFSWRRTRFLAQLLGSVIITQLVLISLVALFIVPRLSRTYTNDQLISPETQLRFTRDNRGYLVEEAEFDFNQNLGQKLNLVDGDSIQVDLPFSMPYFDQEHAQIFISDNRLITFEEPFDYRSMRDGLQAGVALMAMDINPEATNLNPTSGIYFRASERSAIITWLELPLKGDNSLSTAQLTLKPSGTIDLAFVAHPASSNYSTQALAAPWLIGLQSGQFDALPHEVRFSELPLLTEDGRGIIEDYHTDFRSFLNTNISPLIGILLIGLTVSLTGFPLFMGINVRRPIETLVQAVEEVNRGNLDVSLQVLRNDEIGFLTDAFNRMVNSLRDQTSQINEYSTSLENRVIQRTAMLAKMTEKAETAREEAIMANQTKSAFIANVTHEIRTPLNAIVGFGDILREEMEEDGQIEWVKDIDRIKNSANDLLKMINEILDISKIEAGRTTFLYEDFNLRNVVIDIVELLRPIFTKYNNQVTFNSRIEEPMLSGDYMKVRQIIQNLVGNAAKFTENGTIHIVIDRVTDRNRFFYLIKVRDTGIGMTEEQIERVFEPFQQADNSTTRDYGGTGLGLAISRQYAEMMGGRLWTKSQLGVGSTFYFVLPIKPPSSAEIAELIRENGTFVT